MYWLELELDGFNDTSAASRRMGEVAGYFSREAFERLHERVVDHSISSRAISVINDKGEVNDDKMTGLGIQEIEEAVVLYDRFRDEPLPSNLHPYDAAHYSEQRRRNRILRANYDREFRQVLARLSQRVHSYLSQVERHIVLGQLQSDVFEENRRYVDERLKRIAPETLEQLLTAYRRTREGTAEARSHALTSCRRALKSLADRLYPSRSTPVRGSDGKERVLTDAMFVARLWQFIGESGAGSTSKRMLAEDVEVLGDRIDRLNDLASKGVHAEVTEFEVNLCVLSMYSATGALLRLADSTSAATTSTPDLPVSLEGLERSG